MARQAGAGIEAGELHTPLRSVVGPERLGADARVHLSPWNFSDLDNARRGGRISHETPPGHSRVKTRGPLRSIIRRVAVCQSAARLGDSSRRSTIASASGSL